MDIISISMDQIYIWIVMMLASTIVKSKVFYKSKVLFLYYVDLLNNISKIQQLYVWNLHRWVFVGFSFSFFHFELYCLQMRIWLIIANGIIPRIRNIIQQFKIMLLLKMFLVQYESFNS